MKTAPLIRSCLPYIPHSCIMVIPVTSTSINVPSNRMIFSSIGATEAKENDVPWLLK
jgi:hypothetical protein